MNKDETEKSAVKVFVRVRPLIGKEAGSREVVTVDDDVPIILSRTKPYLSAMILSQFFKLSLIMLSPNIAHKDKFLINSDPLFQKYLQAIT